MSAETINKALKILGVEEEQTGHGFRGLASTTMNERSGARLEVIERQLAHKERNMRPACLQPCRVSGRTQAVNAIVVGLSR